MSGRSLEVTLIPLEFPLHEDFDLPTLDQNCPLVRLTQNLVGVLGEHPEIACPEVLLKTDGYPDVEFPAPGAKVEIDIHLASTTEALVDWCGENAVGVFMVTAGPLEDAMYASRFRVGVPCDLEAVRTFVREERLLECDPSSDQHDQSYLEAYLCTLTHELAHAIDLIRHAGGMTPDQVDVLYDSGEIDFDITDAVTGVVVRDEMLNYAGMPEEADEAMEDRVEGVGRDWLRWAMSRIDQELLQSCLDAIKPEPKSLVPHATKSKGMRL